jgi:hypothetical protein
LVDGLEGVVLFEAVEALVEFFQEYTVFYTGYEGERFLGYGCDFEFIAVDGWGK